MFLRSNLWSALGYFFPSLATLVTIFALFTYESESYAANCDKILRALREASGNSLSISYVGEGSSGEVYRATLNDGSPSALAVKYYFNNTDAELDALAWDQLESFSRPDDPVHLAKRYVPLNATAKVFEFVEGLTIHRLSLRDKAAAQVALAKAQTFADLTTDRLLKRFGPCARAEWGTEGMFGSKQEFRYPIINMSACPGAPRVIGIMSDNFLVRADGQVVLVDPN